jgi:ABC-type molybdate transport system substrate-binding protein
MLLLTLTWRVALVSGMLCLSVACRTSAAPGPEVTVAAAANLTAVFEKLGPEFEAQAGIHPVFSFGSTAQLTRQI